jgi:hypothetical protein
MTIKVIVIANESVTWSARDAACSLCPVDACLGPETLMNCMMWMSFINYFKSFLCGNAPLARNGGAWHAGSHQLGIRRSPSRGCWPGAFSRRVSRSSSRDGRAAGQAQGSPPAQQVSHPHETPIIRMVYVADHEQCRVSRQLSNFSKG